MKGEITISRLSGNLHIEKPIQITIRDEYKNITEVELTLEDFAKAITGMGFLPCEITYRKKVLE